MFVTVKKIGSEPEMKKAFAIREEVFVKEQNVAKEDEYDEFEESATHFLAESREGVPFGTARWRYTSNGIKLERFAVMEGARGKGVGMALVEAVLEDIEKHPESDGKTIYLHAQLSAIPLYEKFGFKKYGEEFEECGIKHYQMKKEV